MHLVTIRNALFLTIGVLLVIAAGCSRDPSDAQAEQARQDARVAASEAREALEAAGDAAASGAEVAGREVREAAERAGEKIESETDRRKND